MKSSCLHTDPPESDKGKAKIVSVTPYGEEGQGPKGTVMSASFLIEGQEFVALNDGPQFTFSQAISFVVNCESQEEVDELWEKALRRRRKTTMRLAKIDIKTLRQAYDQG